MQVAMEFESTTHPDTALRGGHCVLPPLYFIGNHDRHHENSIRARSRR
jgi:hypothetical protein